GDNGTPNQDFCSLITRTGSKKSIQFITDINQNVGTLETWGIDFAVRYSPRTSFGRFNFLLDATWLGKFDRTQTAGTTTQTISGKGNFDLGALPALKANLAANWSNKGWAAGGVVHFIGSLVECATPAPDSSSAGGLCYVEPNLPQRDVGANVTFDLH